MKKFLIFAICALIAVSLTACEFNIEVSGTITEGNSSETESSLSSEASEESKDISEEISEEASEEISEESEIPEDKKVVSVKEDLANGPATEVKKFTGVTADGREIWSFETPESYLAQCETLELIGINGDKVYLNIQGLTDNTKNKEGVYCLELQTGKILWICEEFLGGSASHAFADNGILYIGGYLSTACAAIDVDGKMLWKVDTLGDDFYWLYDITIEGDMIKLSFEGDDGKVAYINKDGTVG